MKEIWNFHRQFVAKQRLIESAMSFIWPQFGQFNLLLSFLYVGYMYGTQIFAVKHVLVNATSQ
jgi:hypothetical protein